MTPQTFLTIARKYQAAGYRFDALLAWDLYQARLDKAPGKPCGKSWISARKKCGKDKTAYTKQNRQGDRQKAAKRLQEHRRQKSYSKRGLTRSQIEAEEAKKGKKNNPTQGNVVSMEGRKPRKGDKIPPRRPADVVSINEGKTPNMFKAQLKRGNLPGAIDQAIVAADKDKAFAEQALKDIAQQQAEIDRLAKNALDKYPAL